MDKQVPAGYGVETWQVLFVPMSEFDFERGLNVRQLPNQLPSEHPARPAYVTINDISRKDLVNAIIAREDEFDEMYAKYLRDIRDAGIAELEATATDLVRERTRFWGEPD